MHQNNIKVIIIAYVSRGRSREQKLVLNKLKKAQNYLTKLKIYYRDVLISPKRAPLDLSICLKLRTISGVLGYR